jgi:hypothetical protein
MQSDLKISVELDPIVNVVCENSKCKFNLYIARCGLKHITISKKGECVNFEEITQEYMKAYTERLEGE